MTNIFCFGSFTVFTKLLQSAVELIIDNVHECVSPSPARLIHTERPWPDSACKPSFLEKPVLTAGMWLVGTGGPVSRWHSHLAPSPGCISL